MSRKIKPFLLPVLLNLVLTVYVLPTQAFDLMIDAQSLSTLQNAVLVDTRPSWKYILGHIPRAVNSGGWREYSITVDGVPALNEDKQFIADRLRNMGIDYGKTIVIYGDAKDPWRTDGRFFWMFERFGFDKVILLDGGWEAWQKIDGAVERGSGKLLSPSSLAPADIRMNNEVIAFQKWLYERMTSKSLSIIDNRTQKEFEGATPYGEKRGGHIPGAIHIDWRDFFTDEGKLKNRDTLSTLLEKYGVQKDREIVVYCTGGVRSAMAYFVFRYLGQKVRNYDGSWWDWSHNLSLPVD